MAKGVVWKEVDHYAKRMKRKARDMNELRLKVGVTERSGREEHPNASDGQTIGDIAFFNEYGTMHIPARSFVRDWMDGNLDTIAKYMETDTLRVLLSSTETWRNALSKRGKQYRESMVRRILQRIPPPNSPTTIALKGGDIPLIDTGTLVEAIVYEVAKES